MAFQAQGLTLACHLARLLLALQLGEELLGVAADLHSRLAAHMSCTAGTGV